MDAKKGEWVMVHRIVLTPEKRAPQVPDDTKKVPLEMWVKGYAQSDCNIGDEVEIITITGRQEKGNLCEIAPTYNHSFGNHIPELLKIGTQLREILFGGDN